MGEVPDASYDLFVFVDCQKVPRLIVDRLNVPVVGGKIGGLDCSVF
jgi:hypothetical protein